MKKILNIIFAAAVVLACTCCSYDDSDLRERVDGYVNRAQVLKQKVESLQSQIEALSYLTNGNVITSVTQNSDGKYVITYMDDKDAEYSVVLATLDDIVDVPIVGVALDEEEGIYYWTITTDGVTDWLYADDARIPVRGNIPVLSVDADGYWTVNGEYVLDASGNPVEANTADSSIFQSASYTDGVFTLVLGNGEVITLQVFNTLNLKLSSTATVSIVDETAVYTITYDLSGEAAEEAIVAVAKEAGGAKAELDRETKQISVTFDSDFTSASNAHIIVMAYDLRDNTIIKPVFFTKVNDTNIYISSADELVQFATDYNNGSIPEGMSIFLTQDIDMKNVSSWTPIGDATFNNTNFTGTAFSGTFNGQNHTIKNFVISEDAAVSNGTVGLFGAVTNATIQNVIIGDGSSIYAKSSGITSVGAIAGAVRDGTTIKDCSNYAKINVETGAVDNRIGAGGIVGQAYCDVSEILLSGCKNYGEISSTNVVSTNNGANGINIGGIMGFVNGSSNGTYYTTISGCENHGELNVQATRCGAVVASLNYRGAVVDCVNYANATNTDVTATANRTGGITAYETNDSYIKGCTNYGDMTFAVSGSSLGYAAGVIVQMQVDNTSVTECTNYGTIRSDIIKSSNPYIAAICANTNNTQCEIKDNKVGGKIGPYTEDADYQVVEITADNFEDYIYYYARTENNNVSGNTFAGESWGSGESGTGISTLDDLLAFRDAVNSGASTEEWEDEDGVVNLLADIDMSTVSDWTPIGNGVLTVADNVATVSISGACFSGVFDGGGHCIKNMKISDTSTESNHVFGLFGVIKGAEIHNLQIGSGSDGSSVTVTTSASVWAGALVGMCIDSEVSDCTAYTDFTYNSVSSSGGRSSVAGMIGCCFADSDNNTVQNLVNRGSITADANGNTNNGLAAAPHVGGVVGITSANTSNKKMNYVEYCANYGDLTSNTARTAGVVAAANSYTAINSCFNYGNQTNTIGDTGRLGGITVITGTSSSMQDCINYGDVISTNSARVGGLVSLPNNAANSFTGCANYGQIVSNSSYRGAFWGYDTVASTWVNCHASGYLGSYNGGNYVWDYYEGDNMRLYLGPENPSLNAAVLSNITYDMGASDGEVWTGPEATLKILCIGNSFTKDAVEHLPGIISAAGIETAKIVHMYYGGRTIPEYYSGYSTVDDYTCYTMYPGSDAWVSTRGSTLQKTVQSDTWDIVTIQEHTGNYRAWSWTTDEKNSIQGLIDYIMADQGDNKPKIEYIMSQAYYDMDKIGSGSKSSITWTTQEGMFDVIVEQAKKVLGETDVDEIIPTGTVLQNLRTSSLNVDNGMDLTRDGYHMDYGISRYAAACAVFEMLVSPAFDNIKLDDNTYRYSVSSTSDDGYSTPVTDENQPIALQAARFAIEKPYEVTDMSAY